MLGVRVVKQPQLPTDSRYLPRWNWKSSAPVYKAPSDSLMFYCTLQPHHTQNETKAGKERRKDGGRERERVSERENERE